MGLDVYLKQGSPCDPDDETAKCVSVEMPSACHPEHLFKIGYWRSSYNEGGFNSVMRSYGLLDLYGIAGVSDRDSYVMSLDWPRVAEQARLVLAAFDASPARRYRVFREGFAVSVDDEAPATPQAALALAIAELTPEKAPNFGEWSSRAGFFSRDGLSVHAILHGRGTFGACAYVVAAADDEGAWYREALEVVIETADWVLAQPDPTAFHVHWSA